MKALLVLVAILFVAMLTVNHRAAKNIVYAGPGPAPIPLCPTQCPTN